MARARDTVAGIGSSNRGGAVEDVYERDFDDFEEAEFDRINDLIRRVDAEARASRAEDRKPRVAQIVVEHLGEQLRGGKYGHRLSRDMYAIVNSSSSLVPDITMPEEWCRSHREEALENFDLNMAFFAKIRPAAFESALGEMLQSNKSLRPISDLRTLDGVEGLYVMVLDEYRQAYIGQSIDMRHRIRAHWAGTKQFDRLLWGRKEESVLSIDSFRALDTTRIFAACTVNADRLERKLVRTFSPDYLLNRVGGGKATGIRVQRLAAETKRRQLKSTH